MKNFKLLLASTAILSAGLALEVNAWGDQYDITYGTRGANVTITPSVDIITPVTLTSETELYFGTLVSPKIDDYIIVSADDGTTSGTATVTSIGGAAHRGVLWAHFSEDGSGPGQEVTRTFTFPDKIVLKQTIDDGSETSTTVDCGEVTDFTVETLTNASFYQERFAYGAKFTVKNGSLGAGTCSNTGTVTVIFNSPEPTD